MMKDPSFTAEELGQIEALAARAEPLMTRRAMFVSTGQRFALPVLASFLISKEAMAASGSGGPSMMTMMMMMVRT